MKIERFGWAKNTIDTSSSKYFQKAYRIGTQIIEGVEGLIIDPFARDCEWADITNDLNPNTKAQYHLDAVDFLKLILKKYGSRSVKCLIFDPPFSNRQYKKYEKECEGELVNIYATPGKISDIFDIVRELLAPGGIIIKLGYNTSRPIKDYELVYLSITNFGANHNDVLTSIWKNPNQSIFSFGAEEE